jgi:hypothetical protein
VRGDAMTGTTALGPSLASAYRTWAARLGVPVASLEVAVAYAQGLVAVDVTVISPAPEAEVRRVIDVANRLDATLATLPPGMQQRHRLNLAR